MVVHASLEDFHCGGPVALLEALLFKVFILIPEDIDLGNLFFGGLLSTLLD